MKAVTVLELRMDKECAAMCRKLGNTGVLAVLRAGVVRMQAERVRNTRLQTYLLLEAQYLQGLAEELLAVRAAIGEALA